MSINPKRDAEVDSNLEASTASYNRHHVECDAGGSHCADSTSTSSGGVVGPDPSEFHHNLNHNGLLPANGDAVAYTIDENKNRHSNGSEREKIEAVSTLFQKAEKFCENLFEDSIDMVEGVLIMAVGNGLFRTFVHFLSMLMRCFWDFLLHAIKWFVLQALAKLQTLISRWQGVWI